MKKIGIIGIGGRTGTMFFQELKNFGDVFGIGKKPEIELIKQEKLFVKKGDKEKKIEGNFISEEDFPANHDFDFLFLTVKNPIGEVLKFYYQKIKERQLKIPILFLSQNGIEVAQEATKILREIFPDSDLPIFRISLFNPVDKTIALDKTIICYSLPIQFAMAKISGKTSEKEIFDFFRKENFKIFFLSQKDVKNMEYSKLFLNLIGMASASRGLSIEEGFSRKEVFEEEILATREYKKVVQMADGKFLNFPGYPIKILSFVFSLPLFLLFPFRKIFAKLITKGRRGKQKDLDEIEYYSGAIVKLGKELKIKVPINQKILERKKI